MRKLTLNSAVILYGINAIIALAVAWGFHVSPHTVGAIDTVVAGVITLITLITVRPVEIPAIMGALTTIALALSAFGLHLTGTQVGATSAFIAMALGIVLHVFGIPTVAAVQGKTGQQLMLEANRPGTAPSSQQQPMYPG
jgi:hypothetical protein